MSPILKKKLKVKVAGTINLLVSYCTCKKLLKESSTKKSTISWHRGVPLNYGFRENHNSQCTLLKIMGLSKAFGTINHGLLLAK